MSFVRRSIDSTSEPPCRALFADASSWVKRLVEENRRRHESLGARRLNAAQLAVELGRIRLQAREIRVGIRRVSYLVFGVEEPRDVEIRADVLNDHVGRVAPAADSHVAVRQRETVERDVVGAFHHRDTGTRRRKKGRRVDRIQPGEIRANRGGNAVLSGGRSVAEPGTQRLALTLINAERGRAFREEPQQVLGDVLEQSGHLRLRAIGARTGRRRCAAWKKGERGAGREGRESLTARDGRCGHDRAPLPASLFLALHGMRSDQACLLAKTASAGVTRGPSTAVSVGTRVARIRR